MTDEESAVTKMLPRNEGAVDRVLRIILGASLLSLVFVGPQTAWGWIGMIPLVTGLVGSCPLYTILGLNTCPLTGKSS
jgi:hypothetical protein